MKNYKLYRLLVFSMILVFHWQGAFSQNISSFEYFFDNDPGFGNGQSINVTPNEVVTTNTNLSLANLSYGIHVLYFRAKESGRWSQTHSRLVGVSGAGQISAGEYFFDNDPGFGNGIPISISSGNLTNITFSPDISGLTNEIHSLNIRVFDGSWSQTFTKLIGVFTSNNNAQYTAEYFFDNDPGYGNGINIAGLTSSSTISFSPDISGLSPGLHMIYMRLAGGIYSQTLNKQIIITDDVNNPLGFEYFFDNDPGFGNATTLSATNTSSGVYIVNSNLSLSSLSNGVHILNIRAYNGQYSHIYSKAIGVFDNAISSNFTAEYFFDNDPGFGNATAVMDSTVNGSLSFSIDLSLLSYGIHSISLRVNQGEWSQTYTKDVFVFEDMGISDIEYFIDNDPGYGLATPISFSPTASQVVFNFNAILTSLPKGLHIIGIRTKSGNWSQTVSREFYVLENQNIVAAEYFFNTDPGFGNASSLIVNSGKVVNLNFQANINSLTLGKNYVYARVKTGDGEWSLVYSDSIAITAKADFSADSVCLGSATTFTNLTTDSDVNTAYKWDLENDGTIDAVSSTGFSFTFSTSGNHVVKLIAYQPDGSGDTIIKNVYVIPSLIPLVNVIANNTTICSGSTVIFTATPTNGGTTPTYTWKVNGANVGTNSNTFSSSTLLNSNIVNVVMHSSEYCANPDSAVSTGIQMTVTNTVIPAVSISANNSTICSGSTVIFTATPTNGGTTPIYTWKVNGANVGTNSNTFSSSTLQNSDIVNVVMHSSEYCANPDSAVSMGIQMNVTNTVIPAVAISANNTTICAGSTVIFTATPTNGGTTPIYTWKVNGANVGTNSNTFSSSALLNSDIVNIVMLSSESCANPDSAVSVGIQMNVTNSVIPVVSISANDTTICVGSTVIFTATPTNGGTTPIYTWKVNGVNARTNSNTFSSSALLNSDIVNIVMLSSESCANPDSAVSTGIQMNVTNTVIPAVAISANNTTICSGSTVIFTATATNGGTTPIYSWKVNGANVGTNSNTFTSSTLLNSDIVNVVMHSSESCANPDSAVSTGIQMNVTNTVIPSVSVSANNTTICSGSTVIFTATAINGGTTPTYTWKVNGTNAGTNSNTFTSSTLLNSDIVNVVMFSSESCANPDSAVSTGIQMNVTNTVIPAVSISANDTTICAGSTAIFTATPTNGGTTPIYTWKVNGANVGTNSNTFSSSTLLNSDIVKVVMLSSENCANPDSAVSTGIQMNVFNSLIPSVSVSANDTTICAGSTAIFTTTATNGGTTPTYTWKVNGANAGTNNNTFSSSALLNSDIVNVVMLSSESCANPDSAVSTGIQMNVTNTVIPAVSISANDTTICAGSTAIFTATPTNGGTTPIYTWKVNGANVGTNNNTFSSSALLNGDIVNVVMLSSEYCANPDSAVSTGIQMNVTNSVIPAVSISANDTSICAGSTVIFTATPTNGGTTPIYTWKVNGVNVGTNSNTFSSSTLLNSDIVNVVMLSSEYCANPDSAVSTGIQMNVTNTVIPAVSISSNNTTICVGSTAIFTATPTNGGTFPTYTWKVNGANVGTNSNTLSSSALLNNDIVKVVMLSSESCANPDSAVSIGIQMTVTNSIIPAVSISVNDTTICAGSTVIFTATPINGGTTPIYIWKVNGANVGTNSNIFTSSTLLNSDIVKVVMLSSESCANPDSAVSIGIQMTVTNSIIPAVSISANDTSICAGSTVIFTATSINGGTSPIYTWKVNGANIGTNSNTFSSSTLLNSDIVNVVMHSSESCANPDSAVSVGIQMIVTNSLIPAVSISANDTTICTGSTVIFTATPINGGTTPIYTWKVNGVNVGTNSNTFSSSTLLNSNIVNVVMLSSESCANPDSAVSTGIQMTVNPKPSTPTINLALNDSIECSISGDNYYWFLENILTGFNSKAIKPLQNGNYKVIISINNCYSDSSNNYYYNKVSIDEINNDNTFVIYPNPTTSYFIIDLDKSHFINSIEIISLEGKVVYSKEVNEQIKEIKVELPGLNFGVYFISLKTQNDIYHSRIIIRN